MNASEQLHLDLLKIIESLMDAKEDREVQILAQLAEACERYEKVKFPMEGVSHPPLEQVAAPSGESLEEEARAWIRNNCEVVEISGDLFLKMRNDGVALKNVMKDGRELRMSEILAAFCREREKR